MVMKWLSNSFNIDKKLSSEVSKIKKETGKMISEAVKK